MFRLFTLSLLVLSIHGKVLYRNEVRLRTKSATFAANPLTESDVGRGGARIFTEELKSIHRKGTNLSFIPSKEFFVPLACILAGNSGFLNGLTLSGLLEGRTQSVTAVSEVYTTSALALGDSSVSLFVIQLRLIASYVGGSCLNGFLNPDGIDWSKNQLPLLFSGVLVLLGALYYTSTDWLLCLVAMANGLQNSWTSMLLKDIFLRTTHFTGSTSDIGTYFGQILRGKKENLWKLKILGALIASFWTGGFLAIIAAYSLEELSFLVSVLVYIGLYIFLTLCEVGSLPKAKVLPVNSNRSSAARAKQRARKKNITELSTISNKARKTSYLANRPTKHAPIPSAEKVKSTNRRHRGSMNAVFPFLWAIARN